MRRLVIALLGGPLVAAGLLAGAATATTGGSDGSDDGAAVTGTSQTAPDLAPVDVLQVTGLFDRVVIEAIDDAIDDAAADGSQALILQVNSGGTIASPADMTALIQRVADAPVPIGIWVGPASSARLYGLPAQLMGVADVTAMVSGSRIGHTGRLVDLEGGRTVDFGAATDRLRSGTLSFQDARALGALKLDTPDVGVPTIRSMVAAMDGVAVDGVVLDAEGVDDEKAAPNCRRRSFASASSACWTS
ncbi:MAG: hypothetical protein R2713_16770 [Ilumatobacteraceae bacterium]